MHRSRGLGKLCYTMLGSLEKGAKDSRCWASWSCWDLKSCQGTSQRNPSRLFHKTEGSSDQKLWFVSKMASHISPAKHHSTLGCCLSNVIVFSLTLRQETSLGSGFP